MLIAHEVAPELLLLPLKAKFHSGASIGKLTQTGKRFKTKIIADLHYVVFPSVFFPVNI